MAKRFPRKLPGRYERSEPDTFGDAPSDESGKVRVYVRMIDPVNNNVMRGTISRSFTITEAQVSEVADVIERALFG